MTYIDKNPDLNICLNDKLSRKKVFVIYSFLFALVAFFVFLPYFSDRRTLICGGDAALQHYPALSYYGSYLRDILKTLWNEHRLVIPSWDMEIGYGGDIISTLHYYCFGEPLTLLSVFFSESQSELCYSILVVLRLYLSGIAMLCYCRHRGIKGYSAVVGALIYSFSGYAIAPGVFHPFFMIPMIYLPMLLIGADRLFENMSPVLFILSVALALMSSFYFFYMLVMIVVLYAALQYFSYYKKFDMKEFAHIFFKFLLCAMIGVLIAMPIFLPNLMSILQSNRIAITRQIPLFYPAEYYRSLPEGIISEFGEYYAYLSLSAVAMVSLFTMLALPQKENRSLIIAIAVLFSFLLIPKIGSMFNGFNYVTNRWIWALVFAIGYMTAKILPKTEDLSPVQIIKLLVLTFVFHLLCYLPDHALSRQSTIAIWILCVCVVLVTAVSAKVISKKPFRSIIVFVTMITLVVNSYYHATSESINWVSISEIMGEAYNRYYHSVVKTVDELPNEGAGRFDSDAGVVDYNAALLHDIGGTGFYFSTINPGTAQFQREQMLNISLDQKYSGLDGRTYLDAALSVAYYISGGGEDQPKPYGYDTLVSDNIYTSQHTLPLVYVFDSVYTDWRSMSVTQKQQTLLQRAMTDSDFGLPDEIPEFLDHAVPYQIIQANDVTVDDHSFTVEKAGATLVLRLEPIERCELYCIFENLDFVSETQQAQASMTISSGGKSKSLQYSTVFDKYTSDRHDFLVNLGYMDESRTELTISFNKVGKFCFSDFSVMAQPMDHLFDQIDQLAHSGISDISVENDRISFTSDRENAGIACIAVPYQQGWSAVVNGNKAEVLKIQGGLCGIYLDAGRYDVILEYENPVTNLSIVLCLLGIALFVGVMVIYKKRSRGMIHRR